MEEKPVRLDEFRAALDTGGLLGALRYINLQSPHRFTGLFVLDGDSLTNRALFDRVDNDAPTWEPFHRSKSYCSSVIATGAPFETRDSQLDPRVAEHPARDLVRSYCGVPLLDEEGRVFGTLCHFDYSPQPEATVDLEFMLQLPPLITPYLATN